MHERDQQKREPVLRPSALPILLSSNRSHFGGSCAAARTNTLATLRGRIERIETPGDEYSAGQGDTRVMRMPMPRCRGAWPSARCTRCLPRDARAAAATGFVAGLAGRAAARRPLVWVRQDFAEIESGALSMSGLAELGLDPRLLVTVRAADVDTALRAAADALACDALGVVVLEVWGAGATTRSRRQPQADIGRASVRRHRSVAAGGG